MTITRAMPDVRSSDLAASKAFYGGLLGFTLAMERGDLLNFAAPDNPQVQVLVNGDFGRMPPGFTVDVGSAGRVSEIHAEAVRSGATLVEDLDDKPWGIRRFSLLDPSGNRVTVLAHIEQPG